MADDLDGNVAAEFGVVGTIDLAHPAFAQRCDDLIDAEPGAHSMDMKWRLADYIGGVRLQGPEDSP